MMDEEKRLRIKARKAAYWKAKGHLFKQRRKEYYWANRAKFINKAAQWAAKNHEKHLANRRARYAHPDCHRRKKGVEYARKQIEKGEYLEAQRIRRSKHREQLTDTHVRILLSKRSCLKPSQFPQSLVEVKKQQIQIERMLK